MSDHTTAPELKPGGGAADYIADITPALRDMALKEGHQALAYLLDMAAMEASALRKNTTAREQPDHPSPQRGRGLLQ